MKIEELTEDNILFLQFEGKNQILELPLTLVRSSKNGIITDPVEFSGKIITFNNNEMACKYNLICALPNSKPVIWTDILIEDINIKRKKYLLIRVSGEGALHNRRSTYRLPLDCLGDLQNYGKVIIHDISYNGISFYLSDDRKCNIDQAINLSFIMDDEKYVIQGRIVRETYDSERRRNLYGCRINPSVSIDQFIQEQQRNRIRGKRKRDLPR